MPAFAQLKATRRNWKGKTPTIARVAAPVSSLVIPCRGYSGILNYVLVFGFLFFNISAKTSAKAFTSVCFSYDMKPVDSSHSAGVLYDLCESDSIIPDLDEQIAAGDTPKRIAYGKVKQFRDTPFYEKGYSTMIRSLRRFNTLVAEPVYSDKSLGDLVQSCKGSPITFTLRVERNNLNLSKRRLFWLRCIPGRTKYPYFLRVGFNGGLTPEGNDIVQKYPLRPLFHRCSPEDHPRSLFVQLVLPMARTQNSSTLRNALANYFQIELHRDGSWKKTRIGKTIIGKKYKDTKKPYQSPQPHYLDADAIGLKLYYILSCSPNNDYLSESHRVVRQVSDL